MSNGDQEKPNRLWTPGEDEILRDYVRKHGERKWNDVQKITSLNRDGKSCRQRWLHHLKPDLNNNPFTLEEERRVIELHAQLGNKWTKIAEQLPGRSSYSIRTFWRSRTEVQQHDDLQAHPPQVSQQIQIGNQDAGQPSQADGDDDLNLNGDFLLDLSDLLGDDDLDHSIAMQTFDQIPGGKSLVLLDIKPWDNKTDMNKLEAAVRSVEMPGLLWGASRLLLDGSGIKKLQIMSTIVDDLVSVDSLIDDHLTAEPCNEYVQSCDIVIQTTKN